MATEFVEACPRCNGRSGVALVMRDGTCSLETGPVCHLCHGQPNVPQSLAEAWREREAGRISRIGERKTLFEAARERGLTPLQLSEWEHGKDLAR